MTDFEEFHLDLYHAKLKLVNGDSGLSFGLWDELIQRNIDALSGLCHSVNQVEAHILAAKNYFREKISYPEIIEIVKVCCKVSLHYTPS